MNGVHKILMLCGAAAVALTLGGCSKTSGAGASDPAAVQTAIKADEKKYELLQNVINEMFPDSKVHLALVADKLHDRAFARRS